jgi:hypothetical protein
MYAENQKIGKPNNVKVFRSNDTIRPKQDSQNQLRSSILGMGTLYLIKIIYIGTVNFNSKHI